MAASAVTLAACGGAEEPRPGAAVSKVKRINNEQALELIDSCEASSVIRLHSGEWQLKVKTDTILLVPQPNPSALTAAARKAMDSGCAIAIGTE
jgi:hypothetical protein